MSEKKGLKPDSKRKLSGEILFRYVLAYIFAFVIPFLVKIAFKSHLSIVLVLILVFIKPSIAILSEYTSKKIKRVCITISSVYSFLFVFLIIIGILITPANAYRVLFKEMQANLRNPGRLSNLFILFLAFFSTTFSCTIIKGDYAGPFIGIAFIISLLSGLIFQFIPIYFISLVLIVLYLVYIAFRYLDKGNRVGNILISSVIIGLCLGTGWGFHSMVQIERSKVIDTLSTSLRNVISKLFPQIPLMYELPEYGFAFDDEFRRNLGSTPVLSSIPLFEVQANPGDRTIYLRTRIYEYFENNTWETPAYDLFIAEQEEKKNLTGGEPVASEPVSIPAFEGTGNKADNEIALKVLGEYYHLLPHTLDTVSFRFMRTPPKVIFGDFDKGFYLDNTDMLLSGDVFYLKEEKKEPVQPETFTPYIEVPVMISPQIKQLAGTYTSIPDPRKKIAKIKQDLALNYSYNIDTGGIRENESFLENFLFNTREGYSVHFATALIILARFNNIPARYATGFLAVIPHPREEQTTFSGFKITITGLSAHVWPEVWYDDTGWTIEEATPAVNPEFYTVTGTGILYNKNITLNSMTQQQISALMGDPVVTAKESKDFSFWININPLYFLYGFLVLALVFFFFRSAYVIKYVFKKNRHTVIMLLRKIIKKHKRKGFHLPEEIGWIEWGKQIEQNSLQPDYPVGQFIQVVIQMMYGGSKVRKHDVKAVFAFYIKVKTRKRKLV
ncbi:MAG: hypothetical protein JXB88_05100 [Spirochaetales bacterium]|nr:hypothetical protein [Spirochaetales bacterium]